MELGQKKKKKKRVRECMPQGLCCGLGCVRALLGLVAVDGSLTLCPGASRAHKNALVAFGYKANTAS